MSTKPLGDRRSEGLTQCQAHADLPANTFERELGRKGFFGQSTHMYHQHPPTGWIDWKGPLKPRAYNCNHLQPKQSLTANDDIILDTTPFAADLLLYNKDIHVHFWTLDRAMPKICRNADGDWLLFVHEGTGQFYCDYGHLLLKKGDYLIIPKGTLWRLTPDTSMKMLCVEAAEARFELPDKGILGPHAIFDPALLETPAINASFKQQYTEPLVNEHIYKVIVKKNNEFSQITYPFNPLDAVGWHGDLMPTKINIKQIRPIMSHRYHLPPSVHSTFVAPGFVICTFVPRPFETDENALKIPFFHNNDDYDEVIFYHEGDFFSRDHIEPGMITFHPAGFTHGPHPKALKNMFKQTKPGTNEYAVMIDSRFPLKTTQTATAVEDIGYVRSWQKPDIQA